MEEIVAEYALSDLDLAETLEKIPYGVVVINTQGRITYYNRFQEKIDGFKRDEVLGKHLTDLYATAPELLPFPQSGGNPLLSALKSQRPVYNLFEIYATKKGKIINATHSIIPLFKEKQLRGYLWLVDSFLGGEKNQQIYNAAKEHFLFESLIGSSHDFKKAMQRIINAGDRIMNILLSGEAGTGKSLLAEKIHQHSSRASLPFLSINCATTPEAKLEEDLFGGLDENGHYKPGLFEQAQNGTIYLEDVDSLPPLLQPRLWDLVKNRRLESFDTNSKMPLNVKIISSVATATPLDALSSGALRMDLFYALGTEVVNIPTLKERRQDLAGLISFFVNKHQTILGKKVAGLSPEVLATFNRYNWPGNVKELENIIEGALNVVKGGELVTLRHLPHYFRHVLTRAKIWDEPLIAEDEGEILESIANDSQKQKLIRALEYSQGSLKNAADLLGLSRQLLAYRLKKHGLDRKDFKD